MLQSQFNNWLTKTSFSWINHRQFYINWYILQARSLILSSVCTRAISRGHGRKKWHWVTGCWWLVSTKTTFLHPLLRVSRAEIEPPENIIQFRWFLWTCCTLWMRTWTIFLCFFFLIYTDYKMLKKPSKSTLKYR